MQYVICITLLSKSYSVKPNLKFLWQSFFLLLVVDFIFPDLNYSSSFLAFVNDSGTRSCNYIIWFHSILVEG